MMEAVATVTSHQLADIIKSAKSDKTSTVVIDCRTFCEFNTSHVTSAVNVWSSKLRKKRLQHNAASITDYLYQACGTSQEMNPSLPSKVIVYDQTSKNPHAVPQDSFLYVFLHKLSEVVDEVGLVGGGFLVFHSLHPALCEYPCPKTPLTTLSQPCLSASATQGGPSKVLPFLYLGSQYDANNQQILQDNNITYELNVSTSCPKPEFMAESNFMRIPVNDNFNEKLLPYFIDAFNFIDKAREAGNRILVHCLAGISRSPTVSIAFVMKHLHLHYDEAYRYVKSCRPTISPNINFVGQLLELDRQMNGDKVLYRSPTAPICLDHDFSCYDLSPQDSYVSKSCSVSCIESAKENFPFSLKRSLPSLQLKSMLECDNLSPDFPYGKNPHRLSAIEPRDISANSRLQKRILGSISPQLPPLECLSWISAIKGVPSASDKLPSSPVSSPTSPDGFDGIYNFSSSFHNVSNASKDPSEFLCKDNGNNSPKYPKLNVTNTLSTSKSMNNIFFKSGSFSAPIRVSGDLEQNRINCKTDSELEQIRFNSSSAVNLECKQNRTNEYNPSDKPCALNLMCDMKKKLDSQVGLGRLSNSTSRNFSTTKSIDISVNNSGHSGNMNDPVLVINVEEEKSPLTYVRIEEKGTSPMVVRETPVVLTSESSSPNSFDASMEDSFTCTSLGFEKCSKTMGLRIPITLTCDTGKDGSILKNRRSPINCTGTTLNSGTPPIPPSSCSPTGAVVLRNPLRRSDTKYNESKVHLKPLPRCYSSSETHLNTRRLLESNAAQQNSGGDTPTMCNTRKSFSSEEVGKGWLQMQHNAHNPPHHPGSSSSSNTSSGHSPMLLLNCPSELARCDSWSTSGLGSELSDWDSLQEDSHSIATEGDTQGPYDAVFSDVFPGDSLEGSSKPYSSLQKEDSKDSMFSSKPYNSLQKEDSKDSMFSSVKGSSSRDSMFSSVKGSSSRDSMFSSVKDSSSRDSMFSKDSMFSSVRGNRGKLLKQQQTRSVENERLCLGNSAFGKPLSRDFVRDLKESLRTLPTPRPISLPGVTGLYDAKAPQLSTSLDMGVSMEESPDWQKCESDVGHFNFSGSRRGSKSSLTEHPAADAKTMGENVRHSMTWYKIEAWPQNSPQENESRGENVIKDYDRSPSIPKMKQKFDNRWKKWEKIGDRDDSQEEQETNQEDQEVDTEIEKVIASKNGTNPDLNDNETRSDRIMRFAGLRNKKTTFKNEVKDQGIDPNSRKLHISEDFDSNGNNLRTDSKSRENKNILRQNFDSETGFPCQTSEEGASFNINQKEMASKTNRNDRKYIGLTSYEGLTPRDVETDRKFISPYVEPRDKEDDPKYITPYGAPRYVETDPNTEDRTKNLNLKNKLAEVETLAESWKWWDNEFQKKMEKIRQNTNLSSWTDVNEATEAVGETTLTGLHLTQGLMQSMEDLLESEISDIKKQATAISNRFSLVLNTHNSDVVGYISSSSSSSTDKSLSPSSSEKKEFSAKQDDAECFSKDRTIGRENKSSKLESSFGVGLKDEFSQKNRVNFSPRLSECGGSFRRNSPTLGFVPSKYFSSSLLGTTDPSSVVFPTMEDPLSSHKSLSPLASSTKPFIFPVSCVNKPLRERDTLVAAMEDKFDIHNDSFKDIQFTSPSPNQRSKSEPPLHGEEGLYRARSCPGITQKTLKEISELSSASSAFQPPVRLRRNGGKTRSAAFSGVSSREASKIANRYSCGALDFLLASNMSNVDGTAFESGPSMDNQRHSFVGTSDEGSSSSHSSFTRLLQVS